MALADDAIIECMSSVLEDSRLEKELYSERAIPLWRWTAALDVALRGDTVWETPWGGTVIRRDIDRRHDQWTVTGLKRDGLYFSASVNEDGLRLVFAEAARLTSDQPRRRRLFACCCTRR